MTDRKNVSARLNVETIEEIEAIRDQQAGPLGKPSQADMVRTLVEQGLVCFREHGAAAPRKKREGKKTR